MVLLNRGDSQTVRSSTLKFQTLPTRIKDFVDSIIPQIGALACSLDIPGKVFIIWTNWPIINVVRWSLLYISCLSSNLTKVATQLFQPTATVAISWRVSSLQRNDKSPRQEVEEGLRCKPCDLDAKRPLWGTLLVSKSYYLFFHIFMVHHFNQA